MPPLTFFFFSCVSQIVLELKRSSCFSLQHAGINNMRRHSPLWSQDLSLSATTFCLFYRVEVSVLLLRNHLRKRWWAKCCMHTQQALLVLPTGWGLFVLLPTVPWTLQFHNAVLECTARDRQICPCPGLGGLRKARQKWVLVSLSVTPRVDKSGWF